MRFLRKWIYRAGFRPKLGSIWHSPSLHMIYAWENYVPGLIDGVEKIKPETGLEGWPFDDSVLVKWIQSQMLDMFHAEEAGEMIWGPYNYEILYEEDAIWVYPAKGYFPREEGSFGDSFDGDGIQITYSINTIKLRKVIDNDDGRVGPD